MAFIEITPILSRGGGQDILTYRHNEPLARGTLVRIPYGAKKLNGLVQRTTNLKPKFSTKLIEEVIEHRHLPTELIDTFEWLADYYSTPLSRVLAALLPSELQRKRRVKPQPLSFVTRETEDIKNLNADQEIATNAISSSNSTTHLVHGVTGSGKTRVYLRLASQALKSGKSVIILVPEIALTSQLLGQMQNLFDEQLLLTHSRMSEAQRHVTWQNALNSDVPQVVVGPRSALFTPLKKIGLVIIDEAHDPTYKQDQTPKYHAVTVASQLARNFKAKLVLGTATPSVTQFYQLQKKNIPIITLKKQTKQQKMPEIISIDQKKLDNFGRNRWLSDVLISTIEQTLKDRLQSLIFLNRRGSSTSLQCIDCGWVHLCDHCYLPYTFHADQSISRCHICNKTTRPPTSCPECNSLELRYKGVGTKHIESTLGRLFPHARISRYDRDSLTENDGEMHTELYEGKVDILVGTQSLTKGLDLPKLETVGIISADSGLNFPDFSSSERTFQHIYQVVGRVGRRERAGKVIIQSYQPDHFALQAACNRDYMTFYTRELNDRKKTLYPPFKYILIINGKRKSAESVNRSLSTLKSRLKADYKSIDILGPAPALHERSGDYYRWQIVVKSSRRQTLQEIAAQLPDSWGFNLDPLDLL